ncbi:polyketide synthase, putative [Beauveria bassiana ARSEF 2860]|uniref:Polyketide synthase, putative n=1 Tax=Beauveria bassiana (strain ARSEF 2860) TaxID=655819 RepID=J5JKQ3_BEAB2|nr:polyketide synthase, putative [Beauveria bassiana ARSEF 2860]EJP63776.1 polyketide synthase, putative [Beauveria bassiana ARSEF 2860]
MPMIFDENESALESIVIVGMACRLPGSVDSSAKFWEMLRDKRSDPVDFDPSFFNMTPIEAQWLDPQQRKVLEVCYEVLENAGVPLDKAAGSNTGVYVATFTSDYQQMSIFERDFRHNYAATGVDPGIISNRVNNVFNLAGPSCVINTACSSSVYAIHNACQALRARDCDAAIAAGSNIIMIVPIKDQHMNTAKLGVLSPTSECHTFDERADGYGRAEGVGALYLKRLSDAIRDKDVIRGVIRSSAVNTNGKVEGMGITYPNAFGQEKVLRHAYKRANLNPNKTAYLECHGTGTPTGDPIEVRAVSLGMNDTRSLEKPLLLGAAKASIGHSEAASGIFAAMKAALMTEKAQIPGVYGFRNLNPNIKAKDWNVKVVRDLMSWPSEFEVRRASVSSFGYGGTNAHLVIESIDSICPWYEHGKPKSEATYDYPGADRPFLITMSAHDETTLRRNITAHAAIASDYHLVDLAYTLNQHRSRFNFRGFTVIEPGKVTKNFNVDKFSYGRKLAKPASVGFIFTGQGAQWARMGYDAMQMFPSFEETIKAIDSILQRIEPRPSWTLRDVLEAPVETSAIDSAEISQPVCTAIQIAIVDLFSSWGIEAKVSVGHSSGEIAAAYASGRVSAPEAMLAAYFRGYAVANAAPVGTMLAVGLGATDVEDYLNFLPPEISDRVAIACENSPASITMSGSGEDIASLKTILDEFSVFNRELKTGKAYHSRQMSSVAPLYTELYSKAYCSLRSTELSWRRAKSGMISSLTGSNLVESQISIAYWCDNLRNRVLFSTALAEVGALPEFSDVNIWVEIGPHPALSGPTKQIIQAKGYDMHHVSSLKRGTNSAMSLVKTVGELYLLGLDIDFGLVNSFRPLPSASIKKERDSPRYLPDLPHYQWNYERRYWYQPRIIKELRESKFARHDVLGRRIFGLSQSSSTWRNILRQRDVAWFADHLLGSDVIFPAAGHISLAIEALLQQLDMKPLDASSIRLRDINIGKALVIPDDDDGIEIHTRLEKLENRDSWHKFTIESIDGETWTQHSTGKIKLDPTAATEEVSKSPYKMHQLHQNVSGKRWYRSLRRVGFKYGPNFQTMTNVRANGKDRVASSGIRVQTSCPSMESESRYYLHPSTIDGCLHVVIAAIHRGLHKELPWGAIPVKFDELSIRFPTNKDTIEDAHCTAWVNRAADRNFSGDLQLFGASGYCLLNIVNWQFIAYEAAVPPQLSQVSPRKAYRQVAWELLESTSFFSESQVEGKLHATVFHLSHTSALADSLGATAISLQDVDAETLDILSADSITTFGDAENTLANIVIDDTNGTALTTALTKSSWDTIKIILLSNRPVVWVTRGANSGFSAISGTPQGFLRTVRSEAATSKISLIDADHGVSTQQVATSVLQQLSVVANAAGEGTTDMELWLKEDSQIWVSRLASNSPMNEKLFGNGQTTKSLLSAAVSYKAVIGEDEVHFTQLATEPTSELDPSYVEIQVLFADMSDDILSSRADSRPKIFTGRIIRSGNALDASLCGRVVAAFTLDKLQTIVVTDIFALLPDTHSPDTTAAVLSQLVKAVDAVIVKAKAVKNDHVVVMSDTPSLFEQSIVNISKHAGFSVTILSNEAAVNAEQLLPKASGRTIVVAAKPSLLIPEIWYKMPKDSEFVLSGVALDDHTLEMRPFTRGVKLHVSDVSEDFNSNSAKLKRTLEMSIQYLPAMVSSKVVTFSASSLTDLGETRRVLKQSPASVMGFKYEEDLVDVSQSHQSVVFSDEGAYLLVGCLGGLGRSLTTWMFDRGCKNFVFLSRSGTATSEAAELVRNLKLRGANVDVFAVDASDKKAVGDIVAEVSARRPVKGVVHAAMVLQDALYYRMTFAEFQAAMRPKMLAAIALDEALADTALDFFIMTSSISGVIGNQGQANYAAANSYMDFLALQRRRRGLAACSLALPLVEDVGVVAENTEIADALARKMPFGVSEREMILGFEASIYHGTPFSKDVHIGDVQLVLGLEPNAMLAAMEDLSISQSFWYNDARMHPIRQELEELAKAACTAGDAGANGDFISALAGLSRDEALVVIGTHIMERAARILGARFEDFKYKDASVASHGIDSMIGVELQTWLFKEFGLQVNPMQI